MVPIELVTLVGMGILLAWAWYRTWLRMKAGEMTLWMVLTAGILAWLSATHWVVEWKDAMAYRGYGRVWSAEPYVRIPATMVAVILGMGWVWKLYAAWILGRMSATEDAGGMRGVRAWFGPQNVGPMAFFVVAAWMALGWPVVVTAAWAIGAMGLYPVMRAVLGEGRGEAEGEGLVEERRRVLTMVEMGKISGEDGAELIAALRQTQVPTRRAGGFSAGRRVMVAGTALVVAGFFLPWFRVDGAEMLRAARQMVEGVGAVPGTVPFAGAAKVVLVVHGGEVAHGLGWAVMVLGALAALLPLLWPERGAQRGLTLLLLGAGTVVLMYVMSVEMQGVAEGLVISAVGYGVLWAGVVREYAREAEAGVVVMG